MLCISDVGNGKYALWIKVNYAIDFQLRVVEEIFLQYVNVFIQGYS